MTERVVVAMDGSTHVSTAALLVPASSGERGWRLLARRTDTDSRGQARVLLRLVDEMLEKSGRGPADIGAVVAGTGPGTFTGVRIAVATARALALALEVPVVGVSTLAALAGAAVRSLGVDGGTGASFPDLVVPVVDARRGQAFYGIYRRVSRGGPTASGMAAFARTEPFAVCDRGALISRLPAGTGTVIAGDVGVLGPAEGAAVEGTGGGRPATRRLLELEVAAESLVLDQDRLEEPGEGPGGARLDAWLADVLRRAPDLEAADGSAGWKPGETGSPEAVKPIYVRSPDADIHITKMRDPWAEPGSDR